MISVLSFIAVLLSPTVSTAQEIQDVEKARLRITCIQPSVSPALHGRLNSFLWTRNGNSLRTVTKKMPLMCANTEGAADTEIDIIRTSDGVTIGVPERATDLHYRLVAHEVNADGRWLPNA